MPSRAQTKAAGGNDVGDWGDKSQAGAYPKGHRFTIGGDVIDPEMLPPMNPDDAAISRAQASSGGGGHDTVSMGDMQSTGATGNFGDIYEGEQPRAPRFRRR